MVSRLHDARLLCASFCGILGRCPAQESCLLNVSSVLETDRTGRGKRLISVLGVMTTSARGQQNRLTNRTTSLQTQLPMCGQGLDLFLQMVEQATDHNQSPGRAGSGRRPGRAVTSLLVPDSSVTVPRPVSDEIRTEPMHDARLDPSGRTSARGQGRDMERTEGHRERWSRDRCRTGPWPAPPSPPRALGDGAAALSFPSSCSRSQNRPVTVRERNGCHTPIYSLRIATRPRRGVSWLCCPVT